MLGNLTGRDTISVVVFDHQVETIIKPVKATAEGKKNILAKVAELHPRGSTNVEIGLIEGYKNIEEKIAEDIAGASSLENRLILISDAGANTGETKEGSLAKLVEDYAGKEVGLTALGLGENFNVKLANAISNTHGGTYSYMKTGKDMKDYFKKFDFTVSALAHDFVGGITIENGEAEYAGGYGVPRAEKDASKLIHIKSLFNAGSAESGGATILEYVLPEPKQ